VLASLAVSSAISADVPPDDDGEVVRRARRVPSVRSFSSRNATSFSGVSSALVSWYRYALVGRAAALGHEQELVLVALGTGS
jgi:hypothetical protein